MFYFYVTICQTSECDVLDCYSTGVMEERIWRELTKLPEYSFYILG